MYKDLIIRDYKDEFVLIENFIREVSKLKDSDTYDNVSIYGKSEFIYDIFKILVTDYDFEIGALAFNRDYFDEEYGCEYCLRVFDDMLLVIEKAYDSDFDAYAIDGVVFMNQDDCSQILIDNALSNDSKVILFGIGESDNDCDIDCCDCCDCCGNGVCEKTKDDAATTSTVSYSVNGKSVSKEEYENKMAEFDRVYRKNLLDMIDWIWMK